MCRSARFTLRYFAWSFAFSAVIALAVGPRAYAGIPSAPIGQWGGAVQSVTVAGDTAFVGSGASVVLLDVSQPASPVCLSRVSLPDSVQDIVVSGGCAWVAVATGGLYAIDVSNPAAPAIVGHGVTAGAANALAVSGGFAYVAEEAAGVEVFDISAPASPVSVGL